MRITWKPEKDAANQRKHGLAFERAVEIVHRPTVDHFDDRFDYGEIRVRAIGLLGDKVHTVIYSDRGYGERHLIAAEGPSPMNDDLSGGATRVRLKCDWERLRTMTDAEVHAALLSDPDAQPTDESFWKDARVVIPDVPTAKMTMALDAEILDWYRRRPGMEIRIDSILDGFLIDHVYDPGYGPYDTPPWPDDPAWTSPPDVPREAVTLTLGQRVVDWFTAQDDADRRINAILRRYTRDWGFSDDSDQEYTAAL